MTTCYINGKYKPLSDTTVSITDRGLQFGDGVYEIIAVYQNKVVDMNLHLRRLKISLRKIDIKITLTLKQFESMCDDGIVVSNDNFEYFGEIIDRKCLLWAINENIICDYVIQTIITSEEQLEQQLSRFHIIEENDKRLFLSAFASLKSIFDGHSHHILIYSNHKRKTAHTRSQIS